MLVAMALGMVMSMGRTRAALEKELDAFHSESLAALADNIEDSLASFSPEGVKNTASVLLRDERIVEIEVFSSLFDLHLFRVSKQTAGRRFDTLSLTKNISRGGETLGHVRIDVDKGWIAPRLKAEIRHSLVLFFTMAAGGLSLMLPAVYFKILRPLNRLMNQSRILSKGDLDTECQWRGNDEFSLLGRTLDDMRSTLNRNFSLIKKLAVTDELTGLPNRRGFYLEADRLMLLGARHGHPLSIAVLDLDFFKSVNDVYGHGTGDKVLVAFVKAVSNRIRKSDLFARFGGEEFVLLMPETSIEDAEKFLNSLRRDIYRQEYPHGETLTISVGGVAFDPEFSLDHHLNTADKALYQAKEQGRNRVAVLSAGTR
ncbi:MAG: sensor domain-containing diguanylate cyclase [Desulfobacter sp.]|nr:MAG: sensor domain-containing diguanylate cyclase [Desulfobacter sp.]